MAVRIQFRRGTAAEWTSANPTLAAGELGYETDTAKFKLGDGSTAWTSLDYGGINQGDIDNAIANVIDSSPDALNTLNELAAALNDDADFYNTIVSAISNAQTNAETYAYNLQGEHSSQLTEVHGIENTAQLVYQNAIADLTNQTYVANAISNHDQETTNVHGIANTSELMTSSEIDSAIDGALSVHESDTTSVHGIANTAELATNSDVSSAIDTHNQDATDVHGIANTALLALGTDITNAITTHDGVTTNVHGISNTAELVTTSDLTNTLTTELADYATIDGQTFTGNVTLPSSTSIGDVDSSEIAYLNGVTSAIQTQLDAKLASTTASSTYAPLSGPTFTGTVSLPATTSIGDVSATEIGYVNGVTSDIQTQLDAKAPTADPTFTGTVSGITASMVGLSNVDNTSDADKPVSTAQQTALNAKLSLAGGTMTGSLILDADPTQALGAVTKQYADSIAEGLHVHEAVEALSDSNVDLTGGTFGGTVDGVTLSDGDRVLINGQTSASENGIYVWNATGSTFSRATDFDTPAEASGGDFVFVLGGTTYENTGWVKTSDDVATIGTDPINFTQFSGAGSVTGGTNIEVTGTQVAVVSNPTFANVVTVSSGVKFADNTIQTSAGVPSLTGFTEKTASYTLDTLDHQDNVVEMNSGSAMTFTIPTNASLAWPVGASMDIIQTGAGQVTISPDSGVTLNYTPGNKLRTQWSSCTIMKRATDSWIVYGDLTA